MKTIRLLAALAMTAAPAAAVAQNDGPMTAATFKGFELRNIGPAMMAGRIADIEIVQSDPATWIVGVGSGGVWKTENAGVTWTPIFDGQDVYSIGTVTVDPENPNIIWVGTGENNGGRHLSFGDGVYRSEDGGASWTHKGLRASEHVSEIILHPKDPKTVWVASQGPLWSAGGERGVFKSTDGGESWENVLSAGEWTGATDLKIDPRNPDRLYAAMWQHHRTVAAYQGGGPESGIWRSEDGGETWVELTKGLPSGNMGKIGLAISPQNPDIVYAAIELDRREGGVWRSEDRGASWTKMSDTVSGGTGPHYYQELFASPHKFDRIYLVSNTSQVSEDGGRTFRPINNENKHVDDHAIAFRPDDPDYVMFGSDGGLYESFDHMQTWRFIENLPITQFYKVAVDDAEPFYNIYGGTQDNSTQGGPSRTDNRHGIRNSDWFLTLFADGHQPATEPGNPNIVYSHTQQGGLHRIDRITGEIVNVRAQPAPGDPIERYNWDAPILVSAHNPTTIYHASQRVWRSDDRGDSWRPISGDLTRDEDRMLLPIQGRQWSWDAGWDISAMSVYNTITSLGESPLNPDLLYVGTDDGLIQVTEDGGQTWRRIEVGRLPGVPDRAFVNDIKADLHDEDTVYVALDNHKYGDYKPYLLKSTNRGRSWTSIANNIPDRHLVWRLVQDHVNPNLLFVGTEFGLFFSVDAGRNWIELEGGVPTISFRDLAIQKRENDLVAASFGRSFFVLDDYAPLREITARTLEEDALLFTGRRAWWYIEQHPLGFSPGADYGHQLYRAPNPPFGAVFTYYLKEGLKSLEDQRKEREKPANEAGEDTPFPGFDAIEEELRETDPEIWLTVRDLDGNVIRRVSGPTGKGFHRVAWDLRFPARGAVDDGSDADDSGFLAPPGRYTVTLSSRLRGVTTELAGPREFEVVRLRDGALPGASAQELADYVERVGQLQTAVFALNNTLNRLDDKVDALKIALARTRSAPNGLDDQWQAIRDELFAIQEAMGGQESRSEIGERNPPSIFSRLFNATSGIGQSTYGPTPTHRQSLEWAEEAFGPLRDRVERLRSATIPAFERALIEAGGPYVEGGDLPELQ